MIAFDTETRSLRWWEGNAFLATWAGADWESAEALVPTGSLDSGRFLENLAANSTLIAHNAKFDAHQLRTTLGYDIFENGHTLHDTALMSRVMYGSSRWSHGLEELSKDLLPDGGKAATKASISDIYKSLRGRTSMAYDDAYYEVWVEDPAALEAYAMADVRDTYDLFHVLWPQLEADERLMRVYELELEVMRALYQAERRGVRVDPEAVARLTAAHAERESTAAAALIEHLGFLPEGDGSDDLLRQRLPAIGVELTERTEISGELAVNQQALRPFADHPAVAALFEWRKARKFQSTYLEPLTGVERVHTDVLQSEARTSRMSSRRPNMQNIPKRTDKDVEKSQRMRSVFVPTRGYEFIVADYDQIEPRLAAHYLGDPEYRRVVAENRVYERTCVAAWGGDEADYAKGGERYALRDAGKMVFLSILYGGGGRAVRDNINKVAPPEYHVDVDWVKDPENQFDYPPEAQAIKKKIIADIPGYNALASTSKYQGYGRIAKQVFREGFIRTLLGRKQFIPRDKLYIGLNYLIQGSAAEILKLALVRVAKVLEPHGGHVLLPVHDELLCEVPEGMGEVVLPQVVYAMENVYTIDPALTVEASVTRESYAHA